MRRTKLKATMSANPSLLLLPMAAMPSALATSPISTSHSSNIFTMKQTRQQSEVNLQTCYYNLLQAANYDSTVTQTDFITFIQLSSDNEFGVTNQWGMPISGFNMLNPEFVGIYNLYACGDPLVGCPSIEGIDIGVGGSALQVSDGGGGGLLSGICNDLYDVIDELSVGIPTMSPGGGGGVTTMPPVGSGGVPTASPSIGGTSEVGAPTTAPVAAVPITPVVPTITTSSPTTSASAPTETTTCPDSYVSNTFYDAFAQVTNPNDDSGGTKIYECKDAPYTPWCSQAAYEPGVAMPWEQAWSLVGECVDTSGSTVPATDSPTVITQPTIVTNPDLTTAAPITTEVPDVTTPSGTDGVSTVGPTVESGSSSTVTPGSTDPAVVTTKSPTGVGATPSPVPVTNPDDPLYSGPLKIKFQYEVGNDLFLDANEIATGEPENDMQQVLMDSTALLVEEVVANTFKRRGLRSNSIGMRVLQVSYSVGTTSIDNLSDIYCPSSQPGNVQCQKVACEAELILTNEPKLATELKFKKSLFKAIDDGLMLFPDDSGVVYSHSPRAVTAISEAKNPIDGDKSAGGGEDSSTNSWVVPVSVTVAVLGVLVIVMLIGLHVVRRKHKSEAELVQSSLDGDDLSDDMKGPELDTRQQKGFLQFDAEQGNVVESSKGNQKKGGKNPFFESLSSSSGSSSGSSSSGSSSSSTEDLEEKKPSHGVDTSNLEPYKLPTLNEQSNEDFDKSGQSFGSSRSMYRAGVEALLKESCPEELENLDELMNEYAGREEELIGQLSSMLASMNRSSDVGIEQEEDEHDTLVSSVSSMTSGQEAVPTGYNEVQGQIASALDGKISPSEAVTSDNKAAAAAAAAATLFTGESTKMGLGADWSSSESSDDSDDSSSSEGSSDWSTDEGLSSVDASLETEGSSVVNTTPSMLAAIGVASSITKQVGVTDIGSLSSKSNDEDHATKQELNEAIQAGDWTAVSATAALLAKTEVPLRASLSETSVSSGMSGSTLGQVSLERASEFAKLVEEGDWEGVMRAAAQYEGASDTSSLFDSKRSLGDMSSDYQDGGSPKSQGSTGVRAEVEALVRQVVPDEIDNIDEMMTQFRGREQDLIATLRTMEEQKDNTPGTENSNDLYASPGIISATPSSNSVFESDSVKSPFWDDSSKTNSSLNNGSERSQSEERSSSSSKSRS